MLPVLANYNTNLDFWCKHAFSNVPQVKEVLNDWFSHILA